jgi:hypothetical protein
MKPNLEDLSQASIENRTKNQQENEFLIDLKSKAKIENEFSPRNVLNDDLLKPQKISRKQHQACIVQNLKSISDENRRKESAKTERKVVNPFHFQYQSLV